MQFSYYRSIARVWAHVEATEAWLGFFYYKLLHDRRRSSWKTAKAECQIPWWWHTQIKNWRLTLREAVESIDKPRLVSLRLLRGCLSGHRGRTTFPTAHDKWNTCHPLIISNQIWAEAVEGKTLLNPRHSLEIQQPRLCNLWTRKWSPHIA